MNLITSIQRRLIWFSRTVKATGTGTRTALMIDEYSAMIVAKRIPIGRLP